MTYIKFTVQDMYIYSSFVCTLLEEISLFRMLHVYEIQVNGSNSISFVIQNMTSVLKTHLLIAEQNRWIGHLYV